MKGMVNMVKKYWTMIQNMIEQNGLSPVEAFGMAILGMTEDVDIHQEDIGQLVQELSSQFLYYYEEDLPAVE